MFVRRRHRIATATLASLSLALEPACGRGPVSTDPLAVARADGSGGERAHWPEMTSLRRVL